eukprot:NODE_4341_length_792_cov_48.094737_g4318_i0.p1 GENE.NODE_4341_length_792_cov_48.094737_g4318_i0~~NODE_4341_length_792_cov_48.094737_g4318_i0.p1  ORF type:complete len:218 (-),score=40.02 NODE_4341_length_792_cov_48.094737_g4318_i0:139-735(-)
MAALFAQRKQEVDYMKLISTKRKDESSLFNAEGLELNQKEWHTRRQQRVQTRERNRQTRERELRQMRAEHDLTQEHDRQAIEAKREAECQLRRANASQMKQMKENIGVNQRSTLAANRAAAHEQIARRVKRTENSVASFMREMRNMEQEEQAARHRLDASRARVRQLHNNHSLPPSTPPISRLSSRSPAQSRPSTSMM